MAFPEKQILVLQPAFHLLPMYLYLQVQAYNKHENGCFQSSIIMMQECKCGFGWYLLHVCLGADYFLENVYLSQPCFVNQIDSAAINFLSLVLTPSMPVCRYFITEIRARKWQPLW